MMDTGKSIKQALSTGNASIVRELARTSQTSQQEMAYEFIAELIETRYLQDGSSAA
jgi:hypothetical protein